MKLWLVMISEGRENHSYTFSAPDLATAEKKALELFDDFCFEAGREYDEEYLPDVDLYEISDPTNISVLSHVKEKRVKDEKRRKAAQEEREREQFEFLKKKFEKVHKTNCQCKSCVGM
jgi:hypothetical protein